MTFQPYTFKQLQEIVISRMKGLKAFEEDAIQLAARKVAAVSGDARRALDICRRATEIAENLSPSKTKLSLVGMSHVNAALQEMFSSPKVVAMRYTSSFLIHVFWFPPPPHIFKISEYIVSLNVLNITTYIYMYLFTIKNWVVLFWFALFSDCLLDKNHHSQCDVIFQMKFDKRLS